MRLLLQRVLRAAVDVEEAGSLRRAGEIGPGLLLLAGFGRGDGEPGSPVLPGSKTWQAMCAKVCDLRIFPDADGKLNLSLRDSDPPGGLLLVSQFTLYADARRGRRPSFSGAAEPGLARELYGRLAEDLAALCPGPFGQGVFGAEMRLDFVNWGPVTILLDSADF